MSKSEIARRVESQSVLLVKALGKQVEYVRVMEYGFPRQEREEEIEPILRALRARITNLINRLHTKDVSIEEVLAVQFHMELDRQTRQAQRAKRIRREAPLVLKAGFADPYANEGTDEA